MDEHGLWGSQYVDPADGATKVWPGLLQPTDTPTPLVNFDKTVKMYSTRLPMSAEFVTLDLDAIGDTRNTTVMYNNNEYSPDTPMDNLTTVGLEPGEETSYIFATVHPAGAKKGDPDYEAKATTYVIRIDRVNTVALGNMWVTDTTKDAAGNIDSADKIGRAHV